ncbi:MAG: lipoyl synthase [Gammaproteobacteria bacterium]|nr:lipoyl synthase [Gammaproteobacteria bacterium]
MTTKKISGKNVFLLRKPVWLRVKLPASSGVQQLKAELRKKHLHTVCEEAACPNLGECFSGGTAAFMIMGDICTRRCPFCDVGHGRPCSLDIEEPVNIAKAIAEMQLKYAVITSVNRDDLRDGGAGHFAACICAVREYSSDTRIEVLTPDFRGRMDLALNILTKTPPDVFNHNLETVPRLYKQVRPGADYAWSLRLLRSFKAKHPAIPCKSGLMLGLGETFAEVEQTMADLHACGCEMLTLGQYLQPSRRHLPVQRYVPPDEFDALGQKARSLGFSSVASGPLVPSSFHAQRLHAFQGLS